MVAVKERILELLKSGPKTVEEIVSAIKETKPAVVKGVLTKLTKRGLVKKIGDKYSLA